MIQAADNLGGIRIDCVAYGREGRNAEANENFDCRGILSSFEHTDVFAGNAGSRRHFLLGKASFQAHRTQFGAKHTN